MIKLLGLIIPKNKTFLVIVQRLALILSYTTWILANMMASKNIMVCPCQTKLQELASFLINIEKTNL